jgi:hypothetical protein
MAADLPRLSGYRLAYIVGVPLGWAVLLLFHPNFDVNNIYNDLQDQVNQWMVVHVGTLFFIGLLGAALYLLVRDVVLAKPSWELRPACWPSMPTTFHQPSVALPPTRYRPFGTPSFRPICSRPSALWGG